MLLYVILASMIGAAFFVGAYGVILAHSKTKKDDSQFENARRDFFTDSSNWKN